MIGFKKPDLALGLEEPLGGKRNLFVAEVATRVPVYAISFTSVNNSLGYGIASLDDLYDENR